MTFLNGSGIVFKYRSGFRDRFDKPAHSLGMLFDERASRHDASHLILRNQIGDIRQLAITFLLGSC